MKNQIMVSFLCASLLCSLLCNSQVQGNHTYDYEKETTYMKNTKVVNKENFDISILDQLEGDYPLWSGEIGDSYIVVILGDKSIIADLTKNYTFYSITPKGSYFSDIKIYDPHTSQIREEGEMFDNGSLRLGLWNFYDKDGKLEKTTNYDEPFIFTLDDIFKYCEKHEIVIPFWGESGRNKIERTFIEGKPCWIINSYKHGWLTRVTLDGRTGKEIDRLEGQLY